MSDIMTLTGIVATEPRSVTTPEGLSITSFRLASSQRRFDRQTQSWVDGETNWYTVSSFRRLAENLAASLTKGDPVLVRGRVRIREWQNEQRSGTTVEVEADSVGHDLLWGRSSFDRVSARSAESEHAPASPGSPSASAVIDDAGWAITA